MALKDNYITARAAPNTLGKSLRLELGRLPNTILLGNVEDFLRERDEKGTSSFLKLVAMRELCDGGLDYRAGRC